ncbi:hypothetical protein [Streptomyces xantholiticus]|uniref:Uncharacterized protein n=1 Tax=Streptomyces xantholiticus TaxID=68285 RepID=A0ABV1UXQ0_9ACTN
MSSTPTTPPTSATIPRRPQPPAAPLPDFRHIFLEPVSSHPAAEAVDEYWEDEPRAADRQR